MSKAEILLILGYLLIGIQGLTARLADSRPFRELTIPQISV
jgi:hypothetical protein